MTHYVRGHDFADRLLYLFWQSLVIQLKNMYTHVSLFTILMNGLNEPWLETVRCQEQVCFWPCVIFWITYTCKKQILMENNSWVTFWLEKHTSMTHYLIPPTLHFHCTLRVSLSSAVLQTQLSKITFFKLDLGLKKYIIGHKCQCDYCVQSSTHFGS